MTLYIYICIYVYVFVSVYVYVYTCKTLAIGRILVHNVVQDVFDKT